MKTNISNEEFYSLPFYINSSVLTPRNETEILVNQVLKLIKNQDISDSILIDVGTGSSAIITAIVKSLKKDFKQVFGLDISKDALKVAKINLEINKIEEKINLLNSNLLEIFLKKDLKLEAKNLIITANLPYIKNGDFENMDKEVLENDPHLALFGGEKTGFELYEKLIFQIIKLKNKYLFENINLFIEIGFDQYDFSKSYLEKLGLKFEYFKDYSNIYRVIKIIF